MFKVNNKDTRTTFLLIPFCSFSAVEFKQIDICWIPLYQFINAGIICCCNYWQMCKNLSEIAAHKKGCEVVLKITFFPSRLLCLIAGNSFFSEYSLSLFHKSSFGHPFLNGYFIFKKNTF